jgi:hypothetical protein
MWTRTPPDDLHDIVLDYETFDCCTATLNEVTSCLQTIPEASTSSTTYVLHLVLASALETLPCETVKSELLAILGKHGWNQAGQQFNGVVENMKEIVADIDALADRLLAN